MWAQLIEGSSNPFPILVDIVPRPFLSPTGSTAFLGPLTLSVGPLI